MKRLFFLPLDVWYLTWDAWAIWFSKSIYRQYRSDGFQICHFCREWETGSSPRVLPHRLRKYHNRWLIKSLQPCIRPCEKDASKLRCFHESAVVKYPKWIPFIAVILTTLWILLLRAGWIAIQQILGN
jgi:hypothetical protein